MRHIAGRRQGRLWRRCSLKEVGDNHEMAKRASPIPGPGRLFADDYSSTGQRAWMEGNRGTGPAYWQDDYLGQLRFDSLLAQTLVIPDSHVFDGVFFLARGPRELKAVLGRSGLRDHQVPALEIRGREETLRDSLAALLRRPGHATLNAFVFKSISAKLRYQLAAELKRTPEAELDRALATASDVPAGVASVLETCLRRFAPAIDADAIVRPLRSGWRRWLLEAGDVEIKKWPIIKAFDIEGQARRERSIDSNMRTDAGRAALAEVLATIARGSGHRSDISELLAARRAASAGDDGVLGDLELIDVWYSRLRYRALASKHDCVCALADRPWLPAVGPGHALLREALRLDDPTHVPLPDDVLTALGDLDPRQFQEFVHSHRRVVVSWWATREVDALHALADALSEFTRQRKRGPLGLAQTLPPAGSAIGTLAGGAGGPIGGLIGLGGKAALERRRTDPERVRIRIQEAIEDRVTERR